MKKWMKILLATSMTVLLVACSSSDDHSSEESSDQASSDDQVLRISAIPDYDATELNRVYSEFADQLSEAVGLEVEYVESVDYAAVVTGFERGDIDLAWFGGLTGVQARHAVPGSEAIAQRPLDAEFESVFIKNKENAPDVDSLESISGHTFTFGSESSTSSHLMPRYFLNEAGIKPEEDFSGQVNYSGSHDATMELVETGSYDLGVVNFQYWDSAVENGDVDTNKVEEFYRTSPYYDYHWTVNLVDEKFGEGTKDKIKDFILNLEQEDSALMQLLDAEEFIETNNDNYQAIEEVAKELGIIN